MAFDISNLSFKKLEALKTLGTSDFNAKTDKLGKSYNSSIFAGDFENMQNSALSTVYNAKELKAVFTLLDADGDGTVSQQEVSALSGLGGKGNKVDNKDLKILFSSAKNYAKNTKTNEDSLTTTEVGKNGKKTVTTVNED